jgi:hypothetical protein
VVATQAHYAAISGAVVGAVGQLTRETGVDGHSSWHRVGIDPLCVVRRSLLCVKLDGATLSHVGAWIKKLKIVHVCDGGGAVGFNVGKYAVVVCWAQCYRGDIDHNPYANVCGVCRGNSSAEPCIGRGILLNVYFGTW